MPNLYTNNRLSEVDYWSKRNTAGLLLMPATRHNLIHLNEALQIKRRCQ